MQIILKHMYFRYILYIVNIEFIIYLLGKSDFIIEKTYLYSHNSLFWTQTIKNIGC